MSSFSAPPALDPSATISQAFQIYRDHAGVLLPLAFGLFAIQAVLGLLITDNALGAAVAALAGVVLGIVFQGAIVELARDVEDGTLDSSPGQLLTAITPVILPLFVVGILNAIAVGIGLVFLIIPGLFLLTIFAVVGPATVLERPGIFRAFGRSRELVRGSGGPVFALILFNFVLGLLASGIGSAIGAAGGDAGRVLIGWIVSSLVAPATALVVAVAYLRLRDIHGEKPLPTGVATPDGPRPA